MTQPDAASSTRKASPHAPIIVLGKQNDYLFIGLTVKQAVEHTRDYLAGADANGSPGAKGSPGADGANGTEEPAQQRLGLDELDFFDIAGLPLEPVVVDGLLTDLVIKNYQQEIRDRIVWIARSVAEKIAQAEEGDPAFGEQPLTVPDESLDFEKFIREFAKKNENLSSSKERVDFAPVGGCNWIRQKWGLC